MASDSTPYWQGEQTIKEVEKQLKNMLAKASMTHK